MTAEAHDIECRRIATDGRHVDGHINLPAEVLFDVALGEVGILLYALLMSIGLRLGQGMTPHDLADKLPASPDLALDALQLLRDRQLISWSERECRYYPVLQPLAGAHGSCAVAHHAVLHDSEIPVRAKLLLWTVSLDPYASDEMLAAWRGWSVETVQHWLDSLMLAGLLSRVVEHQVRRVWRGWFRRRRVEVKEVERWAITPASDLYIWPPPPAWSMPVRPRVFTADDLRDMPYDEFLRSGYWADVRAKVLNRDGHRCQGCGATKGLQVHHAYGYAHHGDEARHLEELVTVCRACHRRQHGRVA
jgi:hypothetical protein